MTESWRYHLIPDYRYDLNTRYQGISFCYARPEGERVPFVLDVYEFTYHTKLMLDELGVPARLVDEAIANLENLNGKNNVT